MYHHYYHHHHDCWKLPSSLLLLSSSVSSPVHELHKYVVRDIGPRERERDLPFLMHICMRKEVLITSLILFYSPLVVVSLGRKLNPTLVNRRIRSLLLLFRPPPPPPLLILPLLLHLMEYCRRCSFTKFRSLFFIT